MTRKTKPDELDRSRPEISPQDEYNQSLIANVHPVDWKNPEPAGRYNLVVLGAGTAGLVCAAAVAALGGKAALVERHLLGGDCLNTGCVPSKTILRSSRFYADLRKAELFGASVADQPGVDFAAVMERMRRVRARISRHDSVQRFQQMGVDIFLGQGRFSGPQGIEVDGKSLRFKKAVIATGSRAAVPEVEGLNEAGYLTNETVFNLTKRPDRLLVIGGGPLGCELAQAFRRLGCQVTIVQQEVQFLPREERDAAQILADTFEREEIGVYINTKVKRVEVLNGSKAVHLESEGKKTVVEVDQILVGVGRVPNVEGLDLESAGVQYDRENGVVVNDYLQTTNSQIYSAGDVCLPLKFTHMAEATARIVVQNALFLGRKKLSALTVPWCTYTEPEIAHVGMYVEEARKKGIQVKTFTIPFHEVDRAITDSEDEGFVKIHVRAGSDRILGATVVGRHAGELIHAVSLAIVAGIGLQDIAGVIFPYPTKAEAIKKAADAYMRSRLTERVKKWSTRWLAWTR